MLVELVAWISLITALGIIGLRFMLHCQSVADHMDEEEIERRALEYASHANIEISTRVEIIDEMGGDSVGSTKK